MLLIHTPQGLIDLDAPVESWGAPRWDLIARALGRIARWNGNTERLYTVAEHSIRLWALAPDHLKMAALIHDAAEAFIGDLPAPIRRKAPGLFDNYDSKISFWLFDSLGIRASFTDSLLWDLDRALASSEYRDLCQGDPEAAGMASPLHMHRGYFHDYQIPESCAWAIRALHDTHPPHPGGLWVEIFEHQRWVDGLK